MWLLMSVLLTSPRQVPFLSERFTSGIWQACSWIADSAFAAWDQGWYDQSRYILGALWPMLCCTCEGFQASHIVCRHPRVQLFC